MDALLKKYTDVLIQKNIDYLVLGCTHYPFLIPQLKKIIPHTIQIIDSGEAVARQVQSVLQENNIINNIKALPSLRFYSNKNTETMVSLLDNYKEEINIEYLSF